MIKSIYKTYMVSLKCKHSLNVLMPADKLNQWERTTLCQCQSCLILHFSFFPPCHHLAQFQKIAFCSDTGPSFLRRSGLRLALIFLRESLEIKGKQTNPKKNPSKESQWRVSVWYYLYIHVWFTVCKRK